MQKIKVWRVFFYFLVFLGAVMLALNIWFSLNIVLGIGLLICLVYLGGHFVALNRLAIWLTDFKNSTRPSAFGLWSSFFEEMHDLQKKGKNHEEQLEALFSKLQNTLKNLPDGVVMLDQQGYVDWFNPVAKDHFSLNLELDIGLPFVNLVRDPELANFLQSSRAHQPESFQIDDRLLDVQLIEFEKDYFILVSKDKTEQNRIETMRQDFIANASHELRTPLTIVKGYLEYLLDNQMMQEEQRKHQLELINTQTDRMIILVQDMLILSQLESEVTSRKMIDFEALVQQQMIAAEAVSKGQHVFEVDLCAARILGNESELQSLVANLLTNAIRYTPSPGKIMVSLVSDENTIIFTVKDTGIGIAPEHIPRLTERFYRVSTAHSRATKGTGLGLAIVKHVLMRHKGQLKILSKVSKGSTFRVVLPKTDFLRDE